MKRTTVLRMWGLLFLVISLSLMASCNLFSTDTTGSSEEVSTEEPIESVSETESTTTRRPIVTKEPQTGTTAPADTTKPTPGDSSPEDTEDTSPKYPGIGEILDWES